VSCGGVWVVSRPMALPKPVCRPLFVVRNNDVGNVTGVRTAGGEWERGRVKGHLDK
jgi:hypothetical protein